MQRFAPLLLEIWREAGRPAAIGDALARCAPLLARRLPIDWILLRRIEPARGGVETVAAAACRPGPLPEDARTELGAPELESLVAWARAGRVLHRRARALAEQLPGLLPDVADADVLAGPLAGESDAPGVLVLGARRPRRFDADHAELAQALLDPFGAALESDQRLRDLSTQQAAAEADRTALLTRLGRHDLQETIVGVDGGFRPVIERASLVAPSDVPVLILGETGSGKEVVARAIHQRSRRASGPFLRVNCGAIPSGLVDSELFGHERGSFTGAATQRRGWFERADGGTLFLDEVGELPLPAQVRLLRILQDGSFERVGGQRPLHVDVRIVAATHRDLERMVEERLFREDLWYRLAVFPIHVPPLRDRPEDIPPLASHFALRAAARFGTSPRLPTQEELNLLVDYAWPGNVRELAAVIERAVILGEGRELKVATALGLGRGAREARPAPEPASATRADLPESRVGPPGRRDGAPFLTLDDAVRAHIEAALSRTRGRIEGARGAAALLAINPHTLRARMRKLRIDWQRFRD